MRIQVYVENMPKNIVSLKTNRKGDVYISIFSGTQVGIPPNAIKVLEERFSLHPSTLSKNINTFKHTLSLVDGQKWTTTAISDAIKLKTGFSHLFTHRFGDFSLSKYNGGNARENDIILGYLDTSKQTLVMGVFVGHPDVLFPAIHPDFSVHIHKEAGFQIAFWYSVLELPSIPFAKTFTPLTIAPGKIGNDEILGNFTGESYMSSVLRYIGSQEKLTHDYLETVIKHQLCSKENMHFVLEMLQNQSTPASIQF